MFRKVKIPGFGGRREYDGRKSFGRGGAKQKAARNGSAVSGRGSPSTPGFASMATRAKFANPSPPTAPSRGYLMNVCEQTAIQIAKSLLETPSIADSRNFVRVCRLRLAARRSRVRCLDDSDFGIVIVNRHCERQFVSLGTDIIDLQSRLEPTMSPTRAGRPPGSRGSATASRIGCRSNVRSVASLASRYSGVQNPITSISTWPAIVVPEYEIRNEYFLR